VQGSVSLREEGEVCQSRGEGEKKASFCRIERSGAATFNIIKKERGHEESCPSGGLESLFFLCPCLSLLAILLSHDLSGSLFFAFGLVGGGEEVFLSEFKGVSCFEHGVPYVLGSSNVSLEWVEGEGCSRSASGAEGGMGRYGH
jgi:hypothetical protein